MFSVTAKGRRRGSGTTGEGEGIFVASRPSSKMWKSRGQRKRGPAQAFRTPLPLRDAGLCRATWMSQRTGSSPSRPGT